MSKLKRLVNEFYEWCEEVDPGFTLASALKTDYEKMCIFAERNNLPSPNITHSILFASAKLKIEWEDRQ
jgi:hypothetical protein